MVEWILVTIPGGSMPAVFEEMRIAGITGAGYPEELKRLNGTVRTRFRIVTDARESDNSSY